MNTAKLNEGIALISNIGVFVGLVFLIVELNQSNRIAIAASEADARAVLIAPMLVALENPEILALQGKLGRNERLSDSEDLMARAMVSI